MEGDKSQGRRELLSQTENAFPSFEVTKEWLFFSEGKKRIFLDRNRKIY
jgi:hypothetical protein